MWMSAVLNVLSDVAWGKGEGAFAKEVAQGARPEHPIG